MRLFARIFWTVFFFSALLGAYIWATGRYETVKKAVELAQNVSDPTFMFDQPARDTVAGNFLAGRHAQLTGDWSRASVAFHKLVSLDSQSPDLRQRAMVLSIGAGEFENALADARALRETDIHDLADLLLSVEAVRKNDFEEAKKLVSAIADPSLATTLAPVLQAWLNVATADKDKSAEPMAELRATNPLSLYHRLLVADKLANKEVIAKTNPSLLIAAGFTGKTMERLGDIYLRYGFHKQAELIYTRLKAAQETPSEALLLKLKAAQTGIVPTTLDITPPVATPLKGVAETFSDMASLLYQERSDDSSRIFAQLALYADPTQPEPKIMVANISARAGHPEEAIKYLQSIETSDGALAIRVKRQIAELEIDNNNEAAALVTLQDIVREHKDVDAQIQIGDLYRQQEKYADALKAYDQAATMLGGAKVPKDYWHLLYARGMSLERLKRWEDAEKDLKQALSYQPDHPFILNYLGYSWADQGVHLEKAQDMISKAVMLKPDDGYITDSLGWVYYRLGEFEKAVPVLEQAVELLPYEAVINDHLGDAYWRVGRRNEAQYQWKRAYNNAGSDTELKEAIHKKLTEGVPEFVPLDQKPAK